jgi:GH18 family chitinase
MKHKFLKICFSLLLSLSVSEISAAPRIVGYFPNYAYTTAIKDGIQYQNLTHLNYFSLNPFRSVANQSDGTLWTADPYAWFNMANFTAVVTKARAVNPAIKIFICSGGAPGADGDINNRFTYIGLNAGILNKFCNNILAFIKTNGLDGWDLDWEFPGSDLSVYTAAQGRTSHQNMLARMRFKIDSTNLADGKSYEITIAAGGGYTDRIPKVCWNPAHTDYINAATIPYIDYFNLMTYDGAIGSAPCSFSSHQHFNLMTKAVGDWAADWGIPNSKMLVGQGFYDNGGANKYNSIGNVNTRYKAATWGNGGGGDGCPNIRCRMAYINTNSLAGVIIWELTQDNLCVGDTNSVPKCFSLLQCMYANRNLTSCTLPIELTGFAAGSTIDNKAHIQWTTASESDHDYFILQSSTDGQHFSDVERIASKGSPTQGTEYSYTDSPESATVYYRLVIVSVDGDIEYSKVVALNRSQEFAAYPNPFSHTINFIFRQNSSSTSGVRLRIFNTIGQELVNRQVGPDEHSITLGEEWPVGIYLINIVTSNGVKYYKVEKQ